jgi:hypothetical protein
MENSDSLPTDSKTERILILQADLANMLQKRSCT